MKKKRFFAIIMLMVALVSVNAALFMEDTHTPVNAAGTQGASRTMGTEAIMNTYEQQVFDLVNSKRAEAGLKPLEFKKSALLTDARVRSVEASQKWSHTRPDGTLWYTLDTANMYSECLAYGYNTAESVVNAWMKSPTHKRELMRSDLETGAIGGYIAADGTWYTTFEGGFID